MRVRPSGFVPRQAGWLPGRHRWVELASEYENDMYVIPRIIIHSVTNPDKTREVSVEGLVDGLVAGITSGDTLLMRHGDFG